MVMEKLKASVGDDVFEKAVSLYRSGHIKSYSHTKRHSQYQLKAIVKENSVYGVDVNLDLTAGQLKINSYCSCTTGSSRLCQHAAAVIYQFLVHDLPKLDPSKIKPSKPRGIDELKSLSFLKDKKDLLYTIKGLSSPGDYFELTLAFGGKSPDSLSPLIECLGDVNSSSNRRDLLLKDLSSFDFLIIHYLENNFSSKDPGLQTISLPKSMASLQLIISLIQNNRALNTQGQYFNIGETLKPRVRINGSESRLQLAYDLDEFQGLGTVNKDLHYVMAGNTLHLIHTGGLEKLSGEIVIEPEQLGEVLFEILPRLGEQILLELSPDFQLQTLKLHEPEIELDFSYRENQNIILCNPTVKIYRQIYQKQECRQLLTESFCYQRSTANPSEWSIVNRRPLQELLHFLERNQFEFADGEWQISEKGRILKFFLSGLDQLPVNWQVTTDDAFKGFQITPLTLEPQVKVDLQSDIDWFDFQIYYNLGGITFSHQEILRMLEKTADGNYIQVGRQWFYIAETSKIDFLERMVNQNSSKTGATHEQFYHLPYLRRLLQNQDIIILGNALYNQFETEISHEHPILPCPLPDNLQGELRPYQKEGYYWLRFLHQYHFGGILADDMGLGKTVQVLTLIKSTGGRGPSLVICPRSLIYNWLAETEKFFPGTNCIAYYGPPDSRKALRESFDDQEIIVTTYDIVVNDIEFLADYPFYYTILDEAQQIKNYRTERAKECKRIKSPFRLVLTGTPIENTLEDLWSLFDFVMPDYLGSQIQFKTKYMEAAKKPDSQALAVLRQKIAPFMLRREKTSVLPDLPPKVTMIRKCLMSQLQEDTYRAILNEVKQTIVNSIINVGLEKSRITVLSSLTKLRQICDHPGLVLPEVDTQAESGKVDALMELIEEAIAGECPPRHKIVVFSQFVRMLQLIRAKLEENGIHYLYLDGSTSDRMERIACFNNTPEIPVFLISLKAGGVGINLTAADTVIHTDPWWNPMVEEQATDRVHRIGQHNQVMVYKLITLGTVEEKLLRLQDRKKVIFGSLIQSQDDSLGRLTWEDIQDLFELDDSYLKYR